MIDNVNILKTCTLAILFLQPQVVRLVENLTIQVETNDFFFDVVENGEMMVTCLDDVSPCFVPQATVVFSVHSYYGLQRT